MNIRTLVIIIALLSVAHSKEDIHYRLAKEFVKININVATAHEMGENLTNGLLTNNPQLKPYKEVYISVFKKIFTSNEYINANAKMYMKNFSVDELKYLNKVFSDPKMMPYIKKLPVIAGESMKISQDIAQLYQEELNTALKKRSKEIESLKK